ncbi:MAG: hypothetical protein GQ542_13815 [Desulforhopalus sp.]|nr:hypothetical protein [Desulforhopalus sp.]
MSRTIKIQKVLGVLAKNVEINIQPGLVDSTCIADKLNMTLSETKQILKIMDGMGFVQSNMEADYSLITSAGLTSLHA